MSYLSKAEVPPPYRPEPLDPKGFLERLRNRLLRATTGMRPGPQRLELAIEVFWCAALEGGARTGAPIPWRAFAEPDHPQKALLGPIRLMVRSELISSGVQRPDALTDQAVAGLLEVAAAESTAGARDVEARQQFLSWLSGQLRVAVVSRSAIPA